MLKELTDDAHRWCRFQRTYHHRRVLPGRLLGGDHRREDLRPRAGSRCRCSGRRRGGDPGRDRDAGKRRLESIEHRLSQRHVVERVDQQRLVVVDDQACVRPTPTAVGLQPRVAALADVAEAGNVWVRPESHPATVVCARGHAID